MLNLKMQQGYYQRLSNITAHLNEIITDRRVAIASSQLEPSNEKL